MNSLAKERMPWKLCRREDQGQRQRHRGAVKAHWPHVETGASGCSRTDILVSKSEENSKDD